MRAEATGTAADGGKKEPARNVELLKSDMIKRCQYILEQEEIR